MHDKPPKSSQRNWEISKSSKQISSAKDARVPPSHSSAPGETETLTRKMPPSIAWGSTSFSPNFFIGRHQSMVGLPEELRRMIAGKLLLGMQTYSDITLFDCSNLRQRWEYCVCVCVCVGMCVREEVCRVRVYPVQTAKPRYPKFYSGMAPDLPPQRQHYMARDKTEWKCLSERSDFCVSAT